MALWLIEKETYKLQNPRSFRKKGIFFRETVIKISFQFFFMVWSSQFMRPLNCNRPNRDSLKTLATKKKRDP